MPFDRALFSASIQAKLLHDDISLREAAKESGVSASTLSRLVNGEAPDIDSFSLLISWLGMDANAFLQKPRGTQPELDQWLQLYCCLQALEVPLELIQAILVILRLIVKKG